MANVETTEKPQHRKDLSDIAMLGVDAVLFLKIRALLDHCAQSDGEHEKKLSESFAAVAEYVRRAQNVPL